jgi:cytochrome c553
MRIALVGTIAALLLAGRVAVAAEPVPQLDKCRACHGQNGDSAKGEIPRLNGQSWQYLANRVRSFRDPTKQSAHATQFMWSVNASLNDRQVLALAQYFASQAPTAAKPHGPLADQGRKLYESGDGQGLPACQSCHGPEGQGREAVPRLAGQHGVYLSRQMGNFSLMTRLHATMNPHARNISADQIAALVAYLAAD